MDREYLRTFTLATLEDAKAQMVARGNCDPFARILFPDGRIEDIETPGSIMNDAGEKEVVFRIIGLYAKRFEATAIIIVGDAWTLRYTDEQKQRQQSDSDYRNELYAFCANNGIRKASEAGYGTLTEILCATGQTPEHLLVSASQTYDRDTAIARWPQIRFSGEPVVIDDTQGELTGRMFTIFPKG